MKKLLLLSFFFICLVNTYGQNKGDTLKNPANYSFVIQDSPAQLFTMRQVNESYLSGYRMLSRGLYSAFENDYYADLIQYTKI